ncbi:hypothetical protein PTQ21_21630 [Paenibacillus marchantiae]|uniref:hypothetical protein n=1 Tax=Paenibacillus marchantiae TaxID=3026433 RepID=UPI00237A181D|nr:hypothetical protein [Paenibacillus marchantiae]WDQ31013.1 hypothetical protein PTQ21_21630 [Paenibacillus marchantiae]
MVLLALVCVVPLLNVIALSLSSTEAGMFSPMGNNETLLAMKLLFSKDRKSLSKGDCSHDRNSLVQARNFMRSLWINKEFMESNKKKGHSSICRSEAGLMAGLSGI